VPNIRTGEKADQPKSEEIGTPPSVIDLTGAADFGDSPSNWDIPHRIVNDAWDEVKMGDRR
jgi:hypothetical protein